ncbi:MEMO1 family protein Mho1p [Trichomonascus vanleenenianus]|uniref:Mho1p n=1 Tax=Trichomonascus vanleenenianus TaxID=2268995 RepID=UPI003EC957FA
MASRRATHAGTWYTASKSRLNAELEEFLTNVPESKPGVYSKLPVPGARFLVGPHAGYLFCGQTLAETYKAWDLSRIKRVFILGPSHHVYFTGARLTPFAQYETPLGDIPVDTDTVKELAKHKGLFKTMSMAVDEDEHSFEMHMPFIYKMAAQHKSGIKPIVPILIGHTMPKDDTKLAEILAPYFAEEENAFVISTDFCHWGSRFDYMMYTESEDTEDVRELGRVGQTPIYKSIEYLDRKGMDVLSTGSYDQFHEYLERTDNTICGRRPLAILLRTIETAIENGAGDGKDYGKLHWIGYAQSGKVHSPRESSVSYASGFAVC